MLASNRAEQSRTVYHRVEYQLFEAELLFVSFDYPQQHRGHCLHRVDKSSPITVTRTTR